MDAAPGDAPPLCGSDGSIVNSDAVACFRYVSNPVEPRYERRLENGGCVAVESPGGRGTSTAE
jgi:hypothetical protein